MDGYPSDYIPERLSKRHEKRLLKEMGDFADFVNELDKTHYWCEKTLQHIPRNNNMDLPRSAFKNNLLKLEKGQNHD